MNPIHPLFCVIIFFIAYLTGFIINLKYKLKFLSVRYESIDGLRGFLALGVFIHHSSVWYQYLKTDTWKSPPSKLYIHLGETSVALFFMITSFLFVSKLINTEKDFNWRYFFMSRINRLAPMYYFSITLLVVIVMYISNWQLKIDALQFIENLADWFFFTIRHSSNINNCKLTSMINAGVIWSLPFEWLFYFTLPLISLFILKRKPKLVYIILSVVFIVVCLFFQKISIHFIFSFMGGAIAPILIKYTSFKKYANTVYSSILVLICTLLVIIFFNTASSILCKILITIGFTFIASGNSIFGLLKNSVFRFLGEISYSTYLLHGIILFTVIYFGIGIDKIKYYTAFEYCILMFKITPTVVVLSFLGFKFIEKPFIDRAKKFNK